MVYIPAGRYRVDRLILRDNISIIMQGSLGTAADGYTGELSKRIENGEFAVLVDNLTVNNFLINHDPAGSGRNGCGNITVKGGVIDLNGYTVSEKQIDSKQLGPAENSGRGDTCAFVFSCASGLTVEDVIFRDSYNGHGFQITGAEDVLIKNCLFAGFTIRSNTAGSNTDLVLTRETIQIEYAHSGAIPPSSFRDGEYYHCRNVEINGCCFTKSDRAGYIMVPIGQHGMNGAPNCTGLKIINNVFDNPYLYGIHLLSYEDVEITGNTFVSSLKNVGYSPDECAFIFCDLRNGTQRYAGRDGSGKDVTVTYCNSWENRGTHNVRIEDNDFIIAGNSFFRVLTAQGNDYDTGAVTVRNQIRQEDGSLTGVPYTGFLPVQNVIEGLYFRGNRVTLGGKPSGGHDLIVISDVRDLDISGNSMEGYSGFGSFYGGIEGVSLSGIKNGPDAARKTVLTSLNDRYIELPLGDGVCRLFSDGGERKVTVEAGEGVKDISVNISPDGSCSIGITAEKSAGKTVWETVGGDAALSPGSAVLTGDVTLRVNVK